MSVDADGDGNASARDAHQPRQRDARDDVDQLDDGAVINVAVFGVKVGRVDRAVFFIDCNPCRAIVRMPPPPTQVDRKRAPFCRAASAKNDYKTFCLANAPDFWSRKAQRRVFFV